MHWVQDIAFLMIHRAFDICTNQKSVFLSACCVGVSGIGETSGCGRKQLTRSGCCNQLAQAGCMEETHM